MQSLSNFLLYAFATFAAKGIAFMMLPFVTAFLSLEEYGKLNLLSSFSALASIFVACGLAEILYRFCSSRDSHVNLYYTAICFRFAFKLAFIFALSSALLCSVLFDFIPNLLDPLSVKLLMVSLSFSSFLTVPFIHWRMTNQARPFVVFSLAQVLIQSCLSLWLLHNGLGVVGMMTASAVGSVLVGGAVLFRFSYLITVPSGLKRKHIPYMLYVLIASLLLYGVGGAENWIIVNYLGAETLAVYFLVGQFGLMISVGFEPFRMWWYARRQSLLQTEENGNAKGAVNGFELGILLCIGMLLAGPIVIQRMLPAEYQIAAEYLPWVSVVVACKFHSELFNIGCYVRDNAKWSVVVNGSAATILLVSGLFLVIHFSLLGVLFAVLLANITRALLFILISQRLLYQAYSKIRMLRAWSALAVASLASMAQAEESVFATFVGFLMLVVYPYKEALLLGLQKLNHRIFNLKARAPHV
jgi:O-antigen/teichoic acid export membrane protein